MENKNHIIIINGSPRRNKNCSKIIDNITKKLDDNNIKYEVLNIYKMNIDYCTACGYCDKKGKCIIKDDMTPLYNDFDNSKGYHSCKSNVFPLYICKSKNISR